MNIIFEKLKYSCVPRMNNETAIGVGFDLVGDDSLFKRYTVGIMHENHGRGRHV